MAIQFDNSATGTVTLKSPSSGTPSFTLPSADGTNGQVMQTNGSGVLSFASNFIATNGIFVNSATVSADYTVPSGSNAGSFGPVSVSSGITVTVPSGSVWTVV